MNTVDKYYIGEQDLQRWDGVNSTFTRDSSIPGLTLTLSLVGHFVDALHSYGGGISRNGTTIDSALAAIGTTNKVLLILAPGTWAITANKDWSAYTNVFFYAAPGAVLSHGAYTLKIPNPVSGRYQWLSGTGLVTFYGSYEAILPEWYGDPFTSPLPFGKAFNSAIGLSGDLGGRKISLVRGTYLASGVESGLLNPWSVTIEGIGPTATGVQLAAGSNADVFNIQEGQTNAAYWPSYWIFRNLTIDGNSANNTSGNGIYAYQTNFLGLENVRIVNCAEWNLYCEKCLAVSVQGEVNWGNFDITKTLGSGGVYLLNTGDFHQGGGMLAIEQLYKSGAWAFKYEHDDTRTDPCNIHISNLHVEDDLNGISLDNSEQTEYNHLDDLVFEYVGLVGRTDGDSSTAISITGASKNIHFLKGEIHNTWATEVSNSSTSRNVEIGIHNLLGIIGTADFRTGTGTIENLLPNASFRGWNAGTGWPRGWIFTAGGAAIAADTATFPSAAKVTTGGVGTILEKQLTPEDTKRCLGRRVYFSAWVKASTASGGYIKIDYTAGGEGGTGQGPVYNVSTNAERLLVYADIPTNTTLIVCRMQTEVGATTTWGPVFCGIECAIDNAPDNIMDGCVEGALTGNITFGPYDISYPYGLIAVDPDQDARTITPTGTFFTGQIVIVQPRDHSIVFDPTGINVTVASGKTGLFAYSGYKESWAGAQLD